MAEGATDEELVRLCLDGQPEMFRHLVCNYEQRVTNFLVGRLGGRDDAAEAAQEVMVRAYFALPRLKNPAAFPSWIMGIADRVAKELTRTRSATARLAADDVADRIEARPEPTHLLGSELERAVVMLPALNGEVIRMRFYEGQSCAQIGRRLGISLGTVTSRLSRSYALLRDALREHDRHAEIDA